MPARHNLLTQPVTRRSALAAGIAISAGLPFATKLARAADAAGQTIRISLVKATVCAPSLIIQQFLPTGWKTELTPFTSPGDMTNALLTDSMDLAYTGLTVGIVARSRDQPIVIVANGAGKGTAIVTQSNSSIQKVSDLKGKRVGNLPLSIHDILLREELRKVGLKLEDLNVIRLAPADMPGALQRGDIDAFSGNEPNVTLTVLGGYGRVISYPYDNPVGTINVGVLSSDQAVQKKAGMLKVWAEAHAKATEQLANNPDMWADLVSKEWGYDRKATRESIKNIDLVWKLDARFNSQLAAYMQRLKELDVIARVPETSKLVAGQFIEGVRL
jgi:NitT/TauT family transport system substrate-binding protein